MRILVTGCEGYIGPVLIKMLKERGHEVVGLDIGYFRENVDPGATLVEADKMIIKDIREVDAFDLDGVEAIIHLSALSNDPMGQLDPSLTDQINFRGSQRLASLAKSVGVPRFVTASSCSIYGAAHGSDAPLDETAEFNPVSAYAISKVATENMLRELADDSFSPVYMRNATAYGVSPRMRFDLVLPNLMSWAKLTGVVKVMSDGTPWRPLTHIADISLAAICAAEAPRDVVHNEPFNIGRNDANYQIRDIAEAVKKAAGESVRLEITGEAGGDSRSYRVNFTKAAEKLPGFQPVWTLEKGCDELVDWFAAHSSLTLEASQERNFVRLKQLQYLMESGSVDDQLRVVEGAL